MEAVRRVGKAFVALVGCVVGCGVYAAPTVRVMERGGSLQVYASNPEDRAYTCTLAMVWSHSSFGTRRDVRVRQRVEVSARSADVSVYTGGTGSFDLRIDAPPTLTCT